MSVVKHLPTLDNDGKLRNSSQTAPEVSRSDPVVSITPIYTQNPQISLFDRFQRCFKVKCVHSRRDFGNRTPPTLLDRFWSAWARWKGKNKRSSVKLVPSFFNHFWAVIEAENQRSPWKTANVWGEILEIELLSQFVFKLTGRCVFGKFARFPVL